MCYHWKMLYNFYTNYVSRHTVVCQQAKKTKKDVRHTSVLFTGQIQPSVSPKLLSRFLPNLYIFCFTYTLLHISKLKEISLAVHEIFVPKNFSIFFTFSLFFTQNYKYVH